VDEETEALLGEGVLRQERDTDTEEGGAERGGMPIPRER
jgi:hypothetical protein